jgi:NitT/TauT family transport system ATP-binding protein
MQPTSDATRLQGSQAYGSQSTKLEAKNVSVEYVVTRTGERLVALQDVNLQIREGEFISIVGPSGCGKTTFLNAVDGLLKISRGSLNLGGKLITGPGRDRAMVFQNASLLPWRTVKGNVLYGLELQGRKKGDAGAKVQALIKLVGLAGFEHSYPNELSGGMQQRVNLARALALDPEVLLLDEPFAALDAQTREFMQAELLKVWNATRKTAIFITHQISEAVYLSDRVVVFSARPGKVKQIYDIDIPRPRKLSVKRSQAFMEYEDLIWVSIVEEVRKGGLFQMSEDA